ncbi:MAG: chromosomal replication initiator protein DnaA [Candidatus Yanofskybacteria bacterium]|nr:chromosomal replication initiator protein DnaA [Candidatus Yanofskybacteria bacterium]
MTKEELWQATLAQLQFHISPANFATWLKNTFILSRKDGGIVVSVPNNFSKEWLENKYNKMIFKTLRELDPELKGVTYTVEKASARPQERSFSPIREKEDPQMELQELRVDKTTRLNPRYTFDNFVVGPFNELAHAAAWAIAKNPASVYNPLFVYGGVGLGKTHLLQALGNHVLLEGIRSRIKYVSSEQFTAGVVTAIRNRTVEEFRAQYREIDVLIIDDVQFFAGKDKTQEELFHTFNTLYENGGQIVFSSDRPPKAIPAIEERLKSRFEGGMIADIGFPDYETRLAILKSKLQEKNVSVEDAVTEYIAAHIQRNIRELEGVITKLAAFCLLNNRSPGMADTKTLLRGVIQSPNKAVSVKKIVQVVAEFYDLKEKDLVAASRKKEIVRPRQIAMYLLREELKGSYPFIGNRFGGKDHTTAIYACEKINKDLQESEMLVEEIGLIRQRIYSG